MNKNLSKALLFICFMMVTSAIYSQGPPPSGPGVPPNPVPIPGVLALIIAGLTYGLVKLRKNK